MSVLLFNGILIFRTHYAWGTNGWDPRLKEGRLILMAPTWELTLIDSSSYKARRRGKGDATTLERQNLNRFESFRGSCFKHSSYWTFCMAPLHAFRSTVNHGSSWRLCSKSKHLISHTEPDTLPRRASSSDPIPNGQWTWEAVKRGAWKARCFWSSLSDGANLGCKRSESAPWKTVTLYPHGLVLRGTQRLGKSSPCYITCYMFVRHV